MKNYLLLLASFFIALLSATQAQAQEKTKEFNIATAPQFWQDAIQARYDKFTKNDNFLVYQKTSRLADRNTELPVLVQMFKGRLYHFMIFVDPSVHKVQMKLGKRGVGHILTDKFWPQRDGEIFTDFTYVCSQTGYYLLTVFQRGGKKKQMTHIAVLQKERGEHNGVEFGYD